MPVKVYITPFPEPGFTEACIKGFDEWETRTNGLVAFLRVDDPDQARVKVVWKRMGDQGNSKDCMLGAQTITRWQAKHSTPMGVIPVSGIPVPIFIPRLGAQYSVEPQIIEVNLDLVYSRERGHSPFGFEKRGHARTRTRAGSSWSQPNARGFDVF